MSQPYDVIDAIVIEEREPKLVRAQNGPLAYWCHKAFGKDPNQDAQYFNTAANIFVSLDGIGSRDQSDIAALTFAQHCQNVVRREGWITPESMKEVHSGVHNSLKEQRIEGGTCYLLFGIHGRMVHIYHAGDVKLIILDEKHNKVFETKDHEELITEYFWEKRKVITNSVGFHRLGEVVLDTFPLKEGYRLIAASDGLWKFCPVAEVVDLAREKEAREALDTLATTAIQRRTPLGNGDNINLFVYDLMTLSTPQPL